MGTCTIEDCGKYDNLRRGWCAKHYKAFRVHGDPRASEGKRDYGTPEERAWRKIETVTPFGCWQWRTRELDRNGYGVFSIGTKRMQAHRYIYQLLTDVDPGALDLDHLCRNRACVNPDHLEPVPHIENVRRGKAGTWQAVKTHCAQGHEFTPENTCVGPRGGRACRECTRIANRENMRRVRGTAPDATHNRDKTHCKNGHEFTPANTYLTATGSRACRACTNARVREYQQRKRAATKAGAPM
jgi:hypothetical protein